METIELFALRSVALARLDYLQVAICDRAIDGVVPYPVYAWLTAEQFATVCEMTQHQARRRLLPR